MVDFKTETPDTSWPDTGFLFGADSQAATAPSIYPFSAIFATLLKGRDPAVDGPKLDGIETGATADQTGAEIKTAYEAELDTNAYTDAEKTKLAGIEAGATADQTGAEIKTAYEAELDTNAYTDAEKTKLAGIETGATADQTGAEIKTAYEAELDTNAYTDAEKTKLAGIAAGATVGVNAIGEVVASVRSGLDGKLITGTAGVNGNLVSWNADGDAIDSGVVAANVVVDADIGGTVQGYDADTMKADTAARITANMGFTPVTDTSTAGAVTFDFATGNICKITLTEAITSITLSGATAGDTLKIEITQAAGGYAVSGWPATVKWPGGTAPTITATNGSVDIITLEFDGTNYRASAVQDYR